MFATGITLQYKISLTKYWITKYQISVISASGFYLQPSLMLLVQSDYYVFNKISYFTTAFNGITVQLLHKGQPNRFPQI